MCKASTERWSCVFNCVPMSVRRYIGSRRNVGGLPPSFGGGKIRFVLSGKAPLGGAFFMRFLQGAADTGRIEILCVNRSSRLLAPRFLQIACVNCIEAELIDQTSDNRLGDRKSVV